MSNIILPRFEMPLLHKNAIKMSFENHWKIRKIYREIIGLNNIDHFSMNIADPQHKISVFSYRPSIIYNLFSEGLHIYNGAMSPTFYANRNFFTWEQCYDPRYADLMKTKMERNFGINLGFGFVRKIAGFHIVYVFATKGSKEDMLERVCDKDFFYKVGDYCYDSISTIYSSYLDSYEVPSLNKFRKSSLILDDRPQLKLIR